MNILSPSILAADFWKLGEQISQVRRAGARYLHVDVMDGIFVPSISFGLPVLASIRRMTDLFLDVHLMIEKPQRYIAEFADCGADMLTFHLEASKDGDEIEETIAWIKGKGIKAGLSIRPSTPASMVEAFLPMVDMVLVMTVEPGFGGQEIMPQCLRKVTEIRRMIERGGLGTDVEVDGGITKGNLREVLAAGANVIVAGSAVFHGEIRKNTEELLGILSER
ncbi:MAG: ribulose-phosphate 3-epimerase [Clostridium sp.]|jgi:ribulose-phosphate 3-epimerase|nr:ribulose-phosphate 3-epimerase [Clostridium sp.]